MVSFNAYICKGVNADTIFLHLGHGRLIFMVDQETKYITVPTYETYQELKAYDVSKCELITEDEYKKYGIKIVRLYHADFEPYYRYNIYRFSVDNNRVYILERHDKLSDIYNYKIFSDLEDAMAEVYD